MIKENRAGMNPIRALDDIMALRDSWLDKLLSLSSVLLSVRKLSYLLHDQLHLQGLDGQFHLFFKE